MRYNSFPVALWKSFHSNKNKDCTIKNQQEFSSLLHKPGRIQKEKNFSRPLHHFVPPTAMTWFPQRTDDPDYHHPTTLRSRRRTCQNELRLYLPILVIVCLAILSLPLLATQVTQPSRHRTSGSCGHNAGEARRAGCLFDIGHVVWLPPDCYNVRQAAEFRALGPWPFYQHHPANTNNDTAAQQPHNLSVEDVSRATEGVRTSMQFHLDHCAYAWRVHHEARSAGRKVPMYLTALNHTQHCAMVLRDTSIPPNAVKATIHVGAQECVDP